LDLHRDEPLQLKHLHPAEQQERRGANAFEAKCAEALVRYIDFRVSQELLNYG
jgi:hypothetical protein